MTKLLTSILALAVAFGVYASEDSPLTAQKMEQIKSQINAELDGVGEQVKAQVQEAKEAIERAKNTVTQMLKDGGGEKDVEAALEQVRSQLQKASATMEQLQKQVREQVEDAKDEVQKRLQEKVEEQKKLQDQIRDRVEDGTATGEGEGGPAEGAGK